MFYVVWDVTDQTKVRSYPTSAAARAAYERLCEQSDVYSVAMSNSKGQTLRSYNRDEGEV